jgi:outer membrane protein assembly factor BamB
MRSYRRQRPTLARLAGSACVATFLLALAGVTLYGTAARSSASVPTGVATTSWTVYHGDSIGSGIDTSGVTFSPPNSAWTSPTLDGQLFGEPLESGGRVFVATENDTIYALAADNGSVLWSTNVGTAVPSSDLPCGDISPQVGITGTPVIDQARGEIFVVADVYANNTPAHYLVGLNVYTGSVELNEDVDPPGSSTPNLLQRTGLNLDDGDVVFGYGGNAGDCEPYHGWIASVPEGGGAPNFYDTTGQQLNGQPSPNGTQGAVWQGGAAPEVDDAGNIWAAAGNGSSDSPYDGSDSAIELSSQLGLEQLFAPSNWSFQNQTDQDMSSPPALLPDGLALLAGKSNTAYMLNQSDLGGIGGQLTSAPVCPGSDVDGGHVVLGSIVYLPCRDGVEAVQTDPTPQVLWQVGVDAGTPPISAGGLIWTIDDDSGEMYGLDPGTGAVVQSVSLGSEANHFPTPSVGDGLLLAPASDQVFAFSGSAGVPGPPSPPPAPAANSSYWLVASDGGIFTFGNAPYDGSTGGTKLNEPVVGMAASPAGGYWLVASDGGIFTFGNAQFQGSMGGQPLNAPIVGMAATPDGGGYWLVASDGGIFSFGDAKFYGSMGGQPLNKPIVGMATTRDGLGYWLVASDGGIFSFGDADFHGSMGGTPLNKPVVGMASTPDGLGYWLVASDGGIFNYGDARFFGSTGGMKLNAPVTGMSATSDGAGYWLVGSDGGVFNYGDAVFSGSMGAVPLNKPVVGVATDS